MKIEGWIIKDRMSDKESYIKVFKVKEIAELMKHEREVLQKVYIFIEKEKNNG